jgi:hypothetical protein
MGNKTSLQPAAAYQIDSRTRHETLVFDNRIDVGKTVTIMPSGLKFTVKSKFKPGVYVIEFAAPWRNATKYVFKIPMPNEDADDTEKYCFQKGYTFLPKVYGSYVWRDNRTERAIIMEHLQPFDLSKIDSKLQDGVKNKLVANVLRFVQTTDHRTLDINTGNILMRKDGEIVLIDLFSVGKYTPYYFCGRTNEAIAASLRRVFFTYKYKLQIRSFLDPKIMVLKNLTNYFKFYKSFNRDKDETEALNNLILYHDHPNSGMIHFLHIVMTYKAFYAVDMLAKVTNNDFNRFDAINDDGTYVIPTHTIQKIVDEFDSRDWTKEAYKDFMLRFPEITADEIAELRLDLQY